MFIFNVILNYNMVKIVHRYKEEAKFQERYSRLYYLAKKLFGGRISGESSSCMNGLDKIVINASKDLRKPGISVIIFPSFNVVEVYRKSDFEKALEFAQKGQEITNHKITLGINYH